MIRIKFLFLCLISLLSTSCSDDSYISEPTKYTTQPVAVGDGYYLSISGNYIIWDERNVLGYYVDNTNIHHDLKIIKSNGITTIKIGGAYLNVSKTTKFYSDVQPWETRGYIYKLNIPYDGYNYIGISALNDMVWLYYPNGDTWEDWNSTTMTAYEIIEN